MCISFQKTEEITKYEPQQFADISAAAHYTSDVLMLFWTRVALGYFGK